MNNPYQARGIKSFNAFWRTLIANCTAEMQLVPDTYESHHLNHLLYLQYIGEEGSMFDEELAPEQPNNIIVASQIFGNAMKLTIERHFAVTTKGYMALIPNEAEVGDHIVIFFGANTPFVIRKNKEPNSEGDLTSVLLGEAYIHGMMNGEIFEGEAQLLCDFVLV